MSKNLVRAAITLGLAACILGTAAPAMAGKKGGKAPKAKGEQFTGKVDSVDLTANTVTVKSDTDTKTFALDGATKVSTPDKPKGAALADLKVGDVVSVAYKDDAGKLVAIKVGPKKEGKKKGAA